MDSKYTSAAEKAVASLSRDQLLDLGVGADFWRTKAYPEHIDLSSFITRY